MMMTRAKTGVLGLTLSGFVLAGANKSDKVENSDTGFFQDAGPAGDAVVKLSLLAADRATKPEVKEFARGVADDNAKVSTALASLAAKKDVPKSSLPSIQQPEFDYVTQLDASAFDAAFVHSMVKAHAAAVELFETEAITGLDDEVKAWAKSQLPTLQPLLERARQLDTPPPAH